MKQYLDLAKDILDNGKHHSDRTGVGTTRVFGRQMRFDLREGFPLLTTKKMFTRGIFLELFWMLKGYTNNNWLKERGVNIWNEWAEENGDLGPIYGHQWRHFDFDGSAFAGEPQAHTGTDQLANLLDDIETNPNSRRLIMTAWNPNQVSNMSLPACHCLVQFMVEETEGKGILHCHLYQRSADLFLGVPFNIASYALLTHLIAEVCHLDVGDFIHTFGDVHIYDNHKEAFATQFAREPLQLPELFLGLDTHNRDPLDILTELDTEDLKNGRIEVRHYEHHAAIKADVAV